MTPKKYAVYPGPVLSGRDHQIHHISAANLMFLYGVRWDECLVIYPQDHGKPWAREKIKMAATLIPLRPSNNYTLPTR
jgi:hypothetical protein